MINSIADLRYSPTQTYFRPFFSFLLHVSSLPRFHRSISGPA